MDLKKLQAMGAFVPTKPVKKEIPIKRPVLLPKEEWADPEIEEESGEVTDDSLTVYIRRGSSADDIEMSRASEREQPFVAVYRFVCDEKGQPVFESVEQAMSLKTWLVMPLFGAIAEVRGNVPKHSRRRTSSGSKSPSPSADAARKSGSTR